MSVQPTERADFNGETAEESRERAIALAALCAKHSHELAAECQRQDVRFFWSELRALLGPKMGLDLTAVERRTA